MKITIKEPCSEDWSKMTVTQQGAFCQQCALEVIDFTDLNSLEIKQILANKISSQARVCGRIRNSQLSTINNDFVAWRNAREEVNAIWTLSLIAVFGFALFSCSNNHTKEMLNQISIVSNELLVQDTTQQLTNTETVDSNNVSNQMLDTISISTISQPLSEIYLGGILIKTKEHVESISIFELSISGMMVLGDITCEDPENEELFKAYFESHVGNTTPTPVGNHPVISPIRNSNHLNNSPQGLLDNLNDFKAEIAPLPIDNESKLRLDIFKTVDVHITLKHIDSKSTILDFNATCLPGNFTLSAELNKLPKGDYVFFVSSTNQKERIDFTILTGLV